MSRTVSLEIDIGVGFFPEPVDGVAAQSQDKADKKRQFYTEICRLESCSTRTLQAKMDGVLFERTATVKCPAVVIEETLSKLESDGCKSPDLVFRDPYVGFSGYASRLQ